MLFSIFEKRQECYKTGWLTSPVQKQLNREKSFVWLGFSAHYQIARLAIGRSLGEPNFPEAAPDAKGITIKGNLLFGEEQQGALLWLGLLVENINQHSPNKPINLEVLQHAVSIVGWVAAFWQPNIFSAGRVIQPAPNV